MIAPLANDGKLSKHLPAGTPFGLIGTSSLYKRESYPAGAVPLDDSTATFSGGKDRTVGFRDLDPFNTSLGEASLNWFNQGADAGPYSNDEIHAIRILVMEPTTDRQRGPRSGRTFRSHANERLRILGEIPVRKFLVPAAGGSAKGSGPAARSRSRETRTAIPTPAFSPEFPRTSRSLFRRSISMAWS